MENSLCHRFPSRFQHHVVRHVWEEFCFHAVGPRGVVDIARRDDGILFRAENEQGSLDPFRVREIQSEQVEEHAQGFIVHLRVIFGELFFGHVCGK